MTTEQLEILIAAKLVSDLDREDVLSSIKENPNFWTWKDMEHSTNGIETLIHADIYFTNGKFDTVQFYTEEGGTYYKDEISSPIARVMLRDYFK